MGDHYGRKYAHEQLAGLEKAQGRPLTFEDCTALMVVLADRLNEVVVDTRPPVTEHGTTYPPVPLGEEW